MTLSRLDALRCARAITEAVAAVVDPEIRVLTVEDLGILRDVAVDDTGRTTITVTPTYSGCPAMDLIRTQLSKAARAAGATHVCVETVLSPPWSTDWISEAGRAKLAAGGIAPPAPRTHGAAVPLGMPEARTVTVACPECGSSDTEELSHFGSTACKALWRCRACSEPFEHVKVF